MGSGEDKTLSKKQRRSSFSLKCILLVCVFALGAESRAGLIMDNTLFYDTSSATFAQANSTSRLYAGVLLGATIPKAFFIGWNVVYLSRSLNQSSSDTISGLELGPKFGVYIGKARTFTLSFALHPLVSMTHTSATGSESLSGLSYLFELGFTPQIGKSLFAGIKLMYHMSSYSSSTVGTTQTSVSYSQGTFMPAIFLSWRFGSQ